MGKILIIEDEAAIRRVLSKILSEENDSYQVEDAEDGLQGLEKIKNNEIKQQKEITNIPRHDNMLYLLVAITKIYKNISIMFKLEKNS